MSGLTDRLPFRRASVSRTPSRGGVPARAGDRPGASAQPAAAPKGTLPGGAGPVAPARMPAPAGLERAPAGTASLAGASVPASLAVPPNADSSDGATPLAPGTRTGLIGAVLLLGLVVRVWAIGVQDIWHDEAISLLVSRLSLPDLLAFTVQDVHPPLYYLLLKLWLLPGESVVWARVFGVVAAWPVVPLTLVLARRWFGDWAGIVAGLLAALAPFVVFYTVEIRMYGLLLSLSAATVLAYDSLRRAPPGDWRAVPAVVVLGAALLYTAYAGGLVLLALGIHLLISRRPAAWLRAPRAPLALAGAAALFLPWAGVLAAQAGRVAAGYWIVPPTPFAPVITFAAFLMGYSQPESYRVFGMFLALCFFALSVRVLGLDAWRDALGPRLAFVWLLLPPLVVLAISQLQPIYLDRVVLVAAPAWYVLVGAVIARKAADWPVRILTAGLVVLIAVSLYGFGFVRGYGKAPMQAAAAYVAARWQPGDAVVHTSSGSRFPFAIHAPDLPQSLVPDDPVSVAGDAPSQTAQRLAGDPVPLDAAIAGKRRVWLIVALDHSIDHQRAIVQDTRQRFRRLEEASLGGIAVILFDLRAGPAGGVE